MKPDCLTDQDLILLYYGEDPERLTPAGAATHLAACADCRRRRERLTADLSRIPAACDPDPAAATRLVARVGEHLRPRPRWQPLAGAAAAGAVALAVALLLYGPGSRQPETATRPQVASSQQPGPGDQPLFVGPPRPVTPLDLDLLEQLEFLEDFETLRDIEGV